MLWHLKQRLFENFIICQILPSIFVSSTNKIDRHDITEILNLTSVWFFFLISFQYFNTTSRFRYIYINRSLGKQKITWQLTKRSIYKQKNCMSKESHVKTISLYFYLTGYIYSLLYFTLKLTEAKIFLILDSFFSHTLSQTWFQ